MLKVMTYEAPNLSDRYYVAGIIDSLRELEVLANALDLEVFDKEEEEPYFFISSQPFLNSVTQVTTDVKIGSYVSCTIIGTPPVPNGASLVDEQTTG